MPERRLSQAPTHPQHLISLGTTLTVRNASFLGTILTVPNLLRTIAAFGSHDTVPIVKVGIGATCDGPADTAERPVLGSKAARGY